MGISTQGPTEKGLMCFPVNSSFLTWESLMNLPSNGSVQWPSPCRKVRTVSLPSVHTLQKACLPSGALVLFLTETGARIPFATWLSDLPPLPNTWHCLVHSPSRKIIIPLMGFPLGTSYTIYCRPFLGYTVMQELNTDIIFSIYCSAVTPSSY